MATAAELLKKYQALDVRRAAFEAASAHSGRLVEIQKNQLWAGKNLAGGDLTPSILDDPYFVEKAQARGAKDVQKSAQKMAKAWSDYKDKQQQWAGNPEFGERKKGYPNLIFTTGRLVWDGVSVVESGGELYIIGGTPEVRQEELEAKYGPVFGLNPVGVRYFNERYFRKDFFDNIKKQLYS
jgi:hypothetical protein